jgi:hypothetical protein
MKILYQPGGGIECAACRQQVLDLRSFGGTVYVDPEPAPGGLVLMGGVLRRIVNDWEEAPLGGPRIRKSDAKAWSLIQYAPHERTCPKKLHGRPMSQVTTKPVRIVRRPEFARNGR